MKYDNIYYEDDKGVSIQTVFMQSVLELFGCFSYKLRYVNEDFLHKRRVNGLVNSNV